MSRKKVQVSIIRSLAVEYLTFITAIGKDEIKAVYADENVCLSQKMMATIFDVAIANISQHLKKLFNPYELQRDSVIRKFQITTEDSSAVQSGFEKYHFEQEPAQTKA